MLCNLYIRFQNLKRVRYWFDFGQKYLGCPASNYLREQKNLQEHIGSQQWFFFFVYSAHVIFRNTT